MRSAPCREVTAILTPPLRPNLADIVWVIYGSTAALASSIIALTIWIRAIINAFNVLTIVPCRSKRIRWELSYAMRAGRKQNLQNREMNITKY